MENRMNVIEGGKTPDYVEPADVTAGPLNDVEDGTYARAILFGLQVRRNGNPRQGDVTAMGALQRHKPGRTKANNPFTPPIYMGTVDPVTIAERRQRNKAARKSRKINSRKGR